MALAGQGPRPPPAPGNPSGAGALPALESSFMPERILVVEDDPRLAEMLHEYLGQAGFRITVASLGALPSDTWASQNMTRWSST